MEKEISAGNKIAIIGSGHIGSALAEGLVRSGIQARDIMVAGPSVLQNHKLKKLGIQTTRDNNNAALSAKWIFLAVKPATVPAVLKEMEHSIKGIANYETRKISTFFRYRLFSAEKSPEVASPPLGKSLQKVIFREFRNSQKDKVVISLAAGVRIAALKKYASGARVARIMPNMGIAIGRGVIGYFPGNLAKKDKKELWRILLGLGAVVEVKSEREIDVVTLLSGCGPGIVAFLLAMLADNARMLGLSTEVSDMLARRTFDGTLAHLAHSGMSPKELIKSVATRGGVTEAIIADLKEHGFTKNFARAIGKGYARIKKLNR